MECKTLSIPGVDIAHFDRLLLTANRRLAHYHQNAINLRQISLGKLSWENARIVPLKNWLISLWQDHVQSTELLLSDLHEQALWQSIIEEEHPGLLDIKTSASLALSAYETLKLWNCSLSELAHESNEQVAQFYRFATHFERITQKNHWRNFAQIISDLQKQLTKIPLPKIIHRDGFDDLAPAYQKILETIECKEFHEKNEDDTQNRSEIKKILLADKDTEMWTMARWAKEQVDQNPSIRLGCIVPNLAQNRDRLEYIFTTVFSQDNLLISRTETRHFFNLSAGSNLLSYEIIRIAQYVLDFVEGEFELEKLGLLLQSPYLCSNESDIHLGAKCHAHLLRLEIDSLPLQSLFPPLSEYLQDHPESTWLTRLRAFLAQSQSLSARPPQQWAIFFNDLLEAIGWPGQRTLDSQDYQLCARFHDFLREFSSLDLIYPKLSFKKARQILSDTLKNTIFQAQSVPTRIQILGTLESAGFHFDATWIMGLHDEAWPQAAKPNPFLPYEFQKKNNMPHASPARELSYAKRILDRLLKSAPLVILSAPLRDGDRILQPSALIDFIPLSEIHALFKEKDHPTENLSPHTTGEVIEWLDDSRAPPLGEGENIRGGSWIIKQQAICPFRAFAAVRLKAEALPEPCLGLTPSERGILLHRCLEKIWTELCDHRTLLSKTRAEVDTLIEQVSTSTLEHFKNTQPKPEEKFLHTEKKRLKKLLFHYLEFEKSRSPFSVVATESQFKISIDRLHLQVQVDRIDQLETGQFLIIDYKTGNCSVHHWLGPRPQDPQLPLYCSFTELKHQAYSGISFLEIKPGKLQFKGLLAGEEDAKEILPGLMNTTSWEQQVQDWREAILGLSQEFLNGHARVFPHDPKSCDHCDLQSLCRVKSCT